MKEGKFQDLVALRKLGEELLGAINLFADKAYADTSFKLKLETDLVPTSFNGIW